MIIQTKKCYCLEIFITLITAVGYFLALGPMNFWWFLWIVPLPILIYSFYGRRLVTFIISGVGFFVGNALAFIAYYNGTLMPLWGGVVACIISAFIFAVIIIVNVDVVTRWKHWLTVLFFPAVTVALNYVVVMFLGGLLFPVDYAFTQYHFHTLIQLVSFTGIWGICFLLQLVPNAIAGCIYYRQRHKLVMAIITVTAFICFAALIFGSIKLMQHSNTSTIKVGIAARAYSDPDTISFPQQIKQDLANPKATIEAYISNINLLARQGAKYILQPEYAIFMQEDAQAKNEAILAVQKAAKKNAVTVLFALGEYDNAKKIIKKNHLLVISPQGKILADYHKRHLVAFNESTVKSQTKLTQFSYGNAMLAIAICHDMDYIDPAREYGALGVGLLFNPALDFGVYKDAWWHARIALVQSIANGYALTRAAGYGYLTLSDANGRIIAGKMTEQENPVSLVGDIKLGVGKTFYAEFGDWFAWLSILLFCILGFLAWKTKPKT